MALDIAFQMEALADVNPDKNNTLLLMQVAAKRGHKLFQYNPSKLAFYNGKVIAYGREVTLYPDKEPFYKLAADQYRALEEFDVIMIRQDPPFDIRYVTNTYLLELLPAHTLIVNHPRAIRDFAEKIFPLHFKEFLPRSVITEHTATIRQFWQEEGAVILKPLYYFGGNNIHFCGPETQDIERIAQDLINLTGSAIVAQQYIPEIKQGDKRILFINGEIAGCFLRVPKEGKVAANLMQGGTLTAGELRENDKRIAKVLKPLLVKHGIWICGADIIGNYLTEINITSPIGFKEIQKLYDVDVTTMLWEKIELNRKCVTTLQ